MTINPINLAFSERLRIAMAKARKNGTDVSRACGITRQSVRVAGDEENRERATRTAMVANMAARVPNIAISPVFELRLDIRLQVMSDDPIVHPTDRISEIIIDMPLTVPASRRVRNLYTNRIASRKMTAADIIAIAAIIWLVVIHAITKRLAIVNTTTAIFF